MSASPDDLKGPSSRPSETQKMMKSRFYLFICFISYNHPTRPLGGIMQGGADFTDFNIIVIYFPRGFSLIPAGLATMVYRVHAGVTFNRPAYNGVQRRQSLGSPVNRAMSSVQCAASPDDLKGPSSRPPVTQKMMKS